MFLNCAWSMELNYIAQVAWAEKMKSLKRSDKVMYCICLLVM